LLARTLTEPYAVARLLGEVIPGRGQQAVERVVPRTSSAAYAGSLSSRYGLASLPLHMDTAHWPTPCKYLVMACESVGPAPTPTILLDSWKVQLSDTENAACKQAVFLIRNGRKSFYGTIRRDDRPFLRFDPGCMSPLSKTGEIALAAFLAERHKGTYHRHEWKTGEILVIDNWRLLHGRGLIERTEPGRVLLRATVR
jgi:Taurine catabolism dioxygenase TauD, TfdA family